MKLELQQKFYDEFPEFFPEYFWGFECGEGWFDLLWKLCEDLRAKGFNSEVTQIKEKFAGLRFYVTGATDEQWLLIETAEQDSYKICESCGKEGSLREDSWMYTLCNPCYNEVKKDRVNNGK